MSGLTFTASLAGAVVGGAAGATLLLAGACLAEALWRLWRAR